MENKEVLVKPTHRKHLPYHDYRERCVYHITLVCSDREQVLGRIVGETSAEARCELSPLGLDVARAIQEIPLHESAKGNDVQILAAVCMPDHVHFVLFVRQRMKDRLGMIIRGFKQGCNKRLRRWLEMSEERYGSGNGAVLGGLGKPETPNGAAWGCSCEGTEVGAGARAHGGAREGDREGDREGNREGNCERPEVRARVDAGVGVDVGTRVGAGMGGRARAMSGVAVEPVRMSLTGCLWTDGLGMAGTPLGIDAFLKQLASLSSQRIKVGHALFEDDFDETRLRRKGQLKAMIAYVHKNPMHRWQKQHHPQWLIPMRGIMIAGRSYDAIGNLTLLALSRHQVHVRSRWTDDEKRMYKNSCVVMARKGCALVSPFISPHEAAVRDVCLREGHSVIVLADNGFSDYTQCPGGLYNYCVNGQVLVLVLGELGRTERKSTICRQECVALNEMAREISEEG